MSDLRSISRDRPTAVPDGSGATTPFRGDRYGGQFSAPLTNKELYAADEGSHWVAINPTAGTGIIGHAAPTTFDEAKPYLLVYNGGSNRIYPQSLLLVDSAVSVGGTRMQFNFSLDTGNRLSSGGTTLTKSNVNMDVSAASGATITAGAVVGTAVTANRRLLGNYVIRGANIDVVWDHYEFVFGSPGGSSGGVLTPTTVAQHFTRYLPPVVIGPGQSFAMVQWAASQSTGPTFEVVFSYIER